MGDIYKYPVFFECWSLDTEQKKRVESYFQIRRRSGGGVCGPLWKVNDNVYQIAFIDEKDQERVLKKSEHVLELPGGFLSFTVRGNAGPFTSSTPSPTVRPDLGLTTPLQSHPSIPASTLPSSGVEHELQLDNYLKRYLKEYPRARKELEQELSSMGCNLQLHPEEGKVLVTGSTQICPDGDGVKQWKAKVEKLFERVKEHYLCHFEVDPHKVKVLLQSRSFSQASDDLRVYSDVGIAVVVGERTQVHAMLRNLENSLVKRQGPMASQKQTTIRRLGVAKLRLLWEEIKHGLAGLVPGVKVMQGDAGQLVLEGSVGEVLKALEWVSKKEDLVFDRVVSEVGPHLLAFLRKAYGAPGELGAFLGVGGEVEIELGDTELHLLTLSSGKLDKTEKALQGEFKEVKIEVPNCSAVPVELRAQLESKLNELNQGRHRAVARFSTGSNVYLLGHTTEVEELNEVIIQFILDKSSMEGTVRLPFPEITDHLPELLQLRGFDHLGVTFHPVASLSSPSVVLTGPSSEVTQVMNMLGRVLDSLVRETITIDQPGAQHYFQSPTGKEKLQSVGRTQRCLIQLQDQDCKTEEAWASGAALTQGSTAVATYQFHSGLQLRVCQGDITKEQADALVNAANEDLDHAGGVAAALSRAGGRQVQKESKDLVRQIGKIPTGDVVVTTGGHLNCKMLLHAVGPVGGTVGGRERALLERTVQTALNLAETMAFQSIAMPCISSGAFGVPVKMCAEAIVTAVKDFGSQGRGLNRITLIDNRVEVVRAMQEACDRLLRGVHTGPSTSKAYGLQRVDAAGMAVGGTQGITEIQQDFQSAQGSLYLRGFTTHAHPDQASFYQLVSSNQDVVTAMLGGVKLQLVCGNIIHETTDVIVNTTDFSANQSAGVSKAILTAAGPSVQAELAQVGIPPDFMCTTQAGSLHCREIIHASFKCEAQRIRKTCGKILKWCEGKGYRSAAFPAINTGAAGMDYGTAGKAMLDGMASAVRDLNPNAFSLIRIVMLQKPVFQAFRSELESRLGQISPCLSLREKAKSILKKIQERASSSFHGPRSSPSATPRHTLTPWRPPPAVLCVVGCGSDAIGTSVRRDLETILREQLIERVVAGKDVSRLDVMVLEAVQAKARTLGVSLEPVRGQREGRMNEAGGGAGAWAETGASGQSGSGVEVFYALRGLKEDVLSVNELVDKALRGALEVDLEEKEEALVAFSVQWSMQDQSGAWQELSLHANYLLEQAHLDKVVSLEVEGPRRTKVRVNMKRQEATDWQTCLTYNVKREETATLELPQHWEPMAGEIFKKVELLPTSPEYQKVAQDFQRTAKQYNIHKIERVQNFYLWQAYALCSQRILAKNGSVDVGEKMLYHGTGVEACNRIERTKFDRGYTGTHGAAYGKGVYFAVNAEYSARGYSTADRSGLKRLYVARVLTGRYTVGNSSMKAPPPRSTSDPTDCFDSVVNNQQQPSMFIIFHDDQAYPEYLITFC